jgi:hypothetical protein
MVPYDHTACKGLTSNTVSVAPPSEVCTAVHDRELENAQTGWHDVGTKFNTINYKTG